MVIRRHVLMSASFVFLVMVASSSSLYADRGLAKLKVTARLLEAEIFIDGQHMGDTTWDGTLTVPKIGPGEHKVEVRNWGFTPQSFKLNFEPDKSTYLNVRLDPMAGSISGPLGQIDVHGARRAAMLLNGTTPDYEVAHGGESHGRFHSTVMVPPGTYQLAMVHGDKTYFSGPVTVKEGERTIVNADKGTTTTAHLGPVGDPPRFHGGLLRSYVVVGKTEGNLSAIPAAINCGDSSQLTWNSTDAVHTDISGLGDVAASGQQTVTPTATTTYTLTAKGPGGIETPTTTVTVNNAIDASLNVSPAEVTYERVGDKVTSQPSATVAWSVNGPGATVSDPFGSSTATGNRQIQVEPKQTGNGPVNETVNYTLHATNMCGGDVTKTESLHITGMIKPAESANAAAPPAPAEQAEPVKTAEANELPHTASSMPLIGLIGLASLGVGLTLREAVKRMA